MKIVIWVCVALATGCVVAGRVETFHMTEGEALVYGWKYWTGTMCFSLAAAWMARLNDKEGDV